MKPYFETKLGKLYHGDCVDVMQQLTHVDMTLTSPPYDNLRDYKGYLFDFENIAKDIYKVTKAGGVCVWIVGDSTIDGSETCTSFKQAIYFNEIGFNLHDTMIYQKTAFPFPSKVRYYQNFEYMFVLSKGKPATINLIADRVNKQANFVQTGSSLRYADGELRKKKKKIKIKEKGIRSNIWKYKVGYMKSTKDRIAHKHPAIFPEQLAHDHIISWSNEGDVILDPMCGSGTTAKMAEMLGRRWIGIDTSEEYCEITAKRIEGINKNI